MQIEHPRSYRCAGVFGFPHHIAPIDKYVQMVVYNKIDMMPLTADEGEKGFAHPPSHVVELGVSPGMIIADFGSGSGAHTLALAEATGPEGRIYAIDIQRDLLTRIMNEARRRNLRHVDVLWGDLENPGGSKMADAYADFVLASNILFQLDDKHAALREAARILKPSGMCAVIERTGASGLHRGNVIAKDDLYTIARHADLEPVREFPAGSHHYGILFRPIAVSL